MQEGAERRVPKLNSNRPAPLIPSRSICTYLISKTGDGTGSFLVRIKIEAFPSLSSYPSQKDPKGLRCQLIGGSCRDIRSTLVRLSPVRPNASSTRV